MRAARATGERLRLRAHDRGVAALLEPVIELIVKGLLLRFEQSKTIISLVSAAWAWQYCPRRSAGCAVRA
jgi:hypothetical protein